MFRTQIYFDEEDYQQIAQLAKQAGIKKAAMVRRVVKAGLKKTQNKQRADKPNAGTALLKLAGIAKGGPNDLSENLFDYLYGEKSDYATKKK